MSRRITGSGWTSGEPELEAPEHLHEPEHLEEPGDDGDDAPLPQLSRLVPSPPDSGTDDSREAVHDPFLDGVLGRIERRRFAADVGDLLWQGPAFFLVELTDALIGIVRLHLEGDPGSLGHARTEVTPHKRSLQDGDTSEGDAPEGSADRASHQDTRTSEEHRRT